MTDAMQQAEDINYSINHDQDHLKKIKDRRGRLSNTLLEAHGFGTLVRKQFDPDIYPHFREIKIKAEGDVRYEDIDADYLEELVRKAERHSPKKITDIFNENNPLYQEILGSGYSIWVVQRLNLQEGQSRLWHLPDHHLLNLAEPWGNFTDLHNRKKDLRRHIKARGLDEALIRRAPEFGRHFYIGLGDRPYRSLAELVAGNILESSGLPFECQYRVPLENRQGRPRYCDFFLSDADLLIEIEQCTTGNRGTRRNAYVERSEAKYQEYEAEGFNYITIDSDIYYSSSQGFQAEDFANDLRSKVKKAADTNIPLPSVDKMVFRQISEDIAIILNAPEKEVYQHITEKMGIDSVAKLQNYNSPILKALKQRKDKGSNIIKLMKANSRKRRSEKMTNYHRARRNDYADIEVPKRIVRENNIRNQFEWWQWCKANPLTRERLSIPSSVERIYRQKNQWIDWTDFFGRRKK